MWGDAVASFCVVATVSAGVLSVVRDFVNLVLVEHFKMTAAISMTSPGMINREYSL